MNFEKISYISLFLFGFGLALQVVIWNINRISAELFVLILIFCVLPLFEILVLFYYIDLNLVEASHILLAVFSANLAYMLTYPALKENIPSVKILFYLRDNPGSSESLISNDPIFHRSLVSDKERQLLNDRLLVVKDGKIQITRAGLIFVRFFRFYRKLLGINENFG